MQPLCQQLRQPVPPLSCNLPGGDGGDCEPAHCPNYSCSSLLVCRQPSLQHRSQRGNAAQFPASPACWPGLPVCPWCSPLCHRRTTGGLVPGSALGLPHPPSLNSPVHFLVWSLHDSPLEPVHLLPAPPYTYRGDALVSDPMGSGRGVNLRAAPSFHPPHLGCLLLLSPQMSYITFPHHLPSRTWPWGGASRTPASFLVHSAVPCTATLTTLLCR